MAKIEAMKMIVGSTCVAKMKPTLLLPAPRSPKTNVEPSCEYPISLLTTPFMLSKRNASRLNARNR
jgi:hypothetical protein